MNIILTDHSKRRRSHYPITPDNEIIPWITYFNELFHFKDRVDSIYKIYYKNKAAVLKKEKNKLIVITFRGFKDINKKERYPLNIVNEGLNNKIYRKNFKGDIVYCGRISQYIFSLDNKLRYKYEIPMETWTEQIDISKLDDFVKFDKENDTWMLNDFPRKKEQKIWRIRKNGILISCGRLVDNRIILQNYLMNKYIISGKLFFARSKELDKLIHFDEKRNKWMLNNFERRK